jgi:hypothetical protein
MMDKGDSKTGLKKISPLLTTLLKNDRETGWEGVEWINLA